MTDSKTDDLETRVHQFQALQLPGQPRGMHMGSMYLVSDLWHEVQKLRAAPPVPQCDAGSGDDPTADARWNNGCDFAMMMLCNVLGVDPESVSWDAATETVDGDVQSVISNIMRAKYGEDWDRKAASPPPSGVREALARPWVFEEGNGSSPDEPELLPCIADANGVVLMQIYLDPYESPRVEEKMAAMKAAVSAINSAALSQLPATDEAGTSSHPSADRGTEA